MLTSLSLILLSGIAGGALAGLLRLPRMIGMLLAGILIGPFALNLIDPVTLSLSAELRQAALIIILIKAGLSLRPSDLKKTGRPALLLSCVPAACEILACVLIAPLFLPLSRAEAAVLGAVLGAVSPAVVVPRTVMLTEQGYGTGKHIPQMLLAGASLDDVFVIVLFTAFVANVKGESTGIGTYAGIPLSVLSGVLVGLAVGWCLSMLFSVAQRRRHALHPMIKALLVLSCALLETAAEDLLEGIWPLSGLLAVMSTACMIGIRCPGDTVRSLSGSFGNLWIAAEALLFVLIGAAVDIRYTAAAGWGAVAVILSALLIRSCGVALCLAGTPLTGKERLFCIIAYLPKATVQAAIGGVPLALGLPCGRAVLAVAVLAILITAPLGAIGMDRSYRCLLTREE